MVPSRDTRRHANRVAVRRMIMEMPVDELRRVAWDRSYGLCQWPSCSERAEEMAHLHHRGMGGGPSRNTLGNVLMLCKPDHDMFDGRAPWKAHKLEALIKATCPPGEGCCWLGCGNPVVRESRVLPSLPVWPARPFCHRHLDVVDTHQAVPGRRFEIRLLLGALV